MKACLATGMPFALAGLNVSSRTCLHCGSPVPVADAAFCCAGCESVHTLLNAEGLSRYYALQTSRGAPAVVPAQERTRAWLVPLLESAESHAGPVCSLELDIQGIHCAACVWLINELFRREKGGADIQINPTLGKVRLWWRRGAFTVDRFLSAVERFGYQFGPPRKQAEAASTGLPLRLGICAALTLNVMLFSVSFYVGLSPREGDAFRLFSVLSAVLSSAVVLIGGWPFFRGALVGARRGLLHLDVPIALGIALVYVTSLIAFRQNGRGDLAYFDTLNTFITLMLLGRWLQQRVIDRNRRFLLEDDGAEGLVSRRLQGGVIETVPLPKINAGDVLLVSPGELLPVEGALLDASARISTDWINGESTTRGLKEGERAPAGSFNADKTLLRFQASTDFAQSPLVSLLSRQSSAAPRFAPSSVPFWNALARRWALWVTAAASLGILIWWPSGPERALEVGVALLVVTCPCAIGIAIPLAYELVQSRLRSRGFFIRSVDLLDRLPSVRTVLFDKTGTLTLGRLELTNEAVLHALSQPDRDLLYSLCARSTHPVSKALAAALAKKGARFEPALAVEEHVGRGLELSLNGVVWRLGAPAWACPEEKAEPGATVLSRDGSAHASFVLREVVRPDAVRELSALQGAGVSVWLVSGDAQGRVGEMAKQLAIPPERVLSGQSPEDKAAAVARIDHFDTLFLGDGVNDSLAFDRAMCAGTPAIDRPVMPGKSDFFIVGEGLSPLREALASAVHLRRVVRQILGLSLVYNFAAVSATLLGLMTPLRAAVAMPVSSLMILMWVASQLGGRSAQALRAPAGFAPARMTT